LKATISKAEEKGWMKVVAHALLLLLAGVYGCLGGDLSTAKRLTFDATKFIHGTDTPQLECVGGSAQGSEFEPPFVECVPHNTGVTREWECEAQLGPFVNFDDLEVFCVDSSHTEGDPTQHNCGLKYNLNYTGLEYDESTLTGSFVTIVLGLVIMLFFVRQRRPVHHMPGSANVVVPGIGPGTGGPVNPKVLRMLAYSIFGVVGLATILFSAIVFYLFTLFT